MSTGAGESPTDLASLLEPTATTSSTSSAPKAVEEIAGRPNKDIAIARLLNNLNFFIFFPKFKKIISKEISTDCFASISRGILT